MSSSLTKLQKFFKLERERNYDNRAVVGGLDKILPSWEKEAEKESIDSQLVQYIKEKLSSYTQLDIAERRSTILDLLDQIKDANSEILRPKPISKAPISTREVEQQFSQTDKNIRAPIRQAPVTKDFVGIDSPISVLKGVGKQTADTFEKINIKSLKDLLFYFPRRYDDYSQLKTINRLEYGDELTLIASVQSITTRSIRSNRMQLTEAVVSDGTGTLRITWFNQPWITKTLHPGTAVSFSGKIDMYLGRLTMKSPEWETLEKQNLSTNRIVPIYPLTAGLSQHKLRSQIFRTVSQFAPRVKDYLPFNITQNEQLLDLSSALLNVHFPENQELLKKAQDRLAFDEIFLLQLGVLTLKEDWLSAKAEIYDTPDSWLENRIVELPYQLTNAQLTALSDIRQNIASGHPMNRLLQGDVGSGKTVVAAMTTEMILRHGVQSAIMAPTSILAEQHFNNFKHLLCRDEPGEGQISENEIALLIGATPEAEKTVIRERLANGSIKVVIGTHALLQDPVEFSNLQFVVIDEQHRFGVEQRAILRSKGHNPHLLVMTATPIPRSLALTVYGDLDITVMDEMPVGRQPVSTHVLRPVERQRAYQLIRSQVEKGQQAFIIYPLVEGDENSAHKAAVNEHEKLQQDFFTKCKLGLLHGKMKPAEKDEVMTKFRNGEFDILISTTVIEVGVDVPNATVMLIEGANHFGLAQLHQLRGRVGRGNEKAYCILIPESDESSENQRLTVMTQTNNGFVLAEKDLEQRGPGDFLGTRQAGFSELKMASLSDVHLIERARNQAQALFEKDPTISNPKYKDLYYQMQQFWNSTLGEIS
jgi:ATP-dependent DNA helicase RecG